MAQGERNYPKMKIKAKKKIILLLMTTMLLITAACGSANDTPANQTQKTFTLEVTDADGNVTTQTIRTTEETVGAALIKEGLIAGDESEFGLMVMYVNGIRADFVEDSAWWAFYIDDEMAMAGVDSIDIEDGVTYKFIYTPA